MSGGFTHVIIRVLFENSAILPFSQFSKSYYESVANYLE